MKPCLETSFNAKSQLRIIALLGLCFAFAVVTALPARGADVDLSQATVVINVNGVSSSQEAAAEILVEEIEKRTGILLQTSTNWPTEDRTAIVLTTKKTEIIGGKEVPHRTGTDLPEAQPEGFRLFVDQETDAGNVVWILGADPRGVLYGVGCLLRHLVWSQNVASIPADLEIATSPAYPIRGHQLGYRAKSNSYDAWTPEMYEQYIRESIVFGANCIENIPFQDEHPSPHMLVRREVMNVALGEICAKYGIDHWIWAPAVFDLTDDASRNALLRQHEDFFRNCPRLDALFFPGGDPGNNPPELVLVFLEETARRLARYHPKAGVWLSMQGFDPEEVDVVYDYLDREKPDWFTGIVAGPSSPPIPETRRRLPAKYRLRHYPDITHTVRCQYPVQWWDPAFNFTLGREAINPQPRYYALVHNWLAPYTDGFLTYSDGINDDVNKAVWSQRGWAPEYPVRDILVEYARFFFGPGVAEPAADGILALESNWVGSLAENGAVDATFSHWRWLQEKAPQLESNWRWLMCLFRAHYDCYTRHRLLHESELEDEANSILAQAGELGADAAMERALNVIDRAVQDPFSPQFRERIIGLGDRLFELIGLQLDYERHQGSGTERGCSLTFLDYPLNNRWWLEDEFHKVRQMKTEEEKLAHLEVLRTWENPGEGSFYDDLGNIAQSAHVVRGEALNTDPLMVDDPNPGYWWWDSGMSRKRLSWQVSMDFPKAMRYVGLDPDGEYLVRMTGQGESLLRIDGDRAKLSRYSKEAEAFKEFPVPKKALEDGCILLTWDKPDEAHLNWREQSYVAEVWLLKKGD